MVIGTAMAGASLVGQADNDRVPPRRPNALTDDHSETYRAEPEKPAKAEAAKRYFGPYEALVYDEAILDDVEVKDPNNTIWLRLKPAHKDKEIQVKISNEKFSSYRKWYTTNDFVLTSPANAGKPAGALTDWLRTEANYIEYWMDGQLFLHLKRRR